jgi:hypothetical protein
MIGLDMSISDHGKILPLAEVFENVIEKTNNKVQ